MVQVGQQHGDSQRRIFRGGYGLHGRCRRPCVVADVFRDGSVRHHNHERHPNGGEHNPAHVVHFRAEWRWKLRRGILQGAALLNENMAGRRACTRLCAGHQGRLRMPLRSCERQLLVLQQRRDHVRRRARGPARRSPQLSCVQAFLSWLRRQFIYRYGRSRQSGPCRKGRVRVDRSLPRRRPARPWLL